MIKVENVSKYYGGSRAVTDLSFEIRQGECVGFLGLNGAGKSTTLRLLACLLLPTTGRIRIRDLDVVDEPHAIRRLIGYLPDQPPLYLEMSVEEYLRFAGRIRGLTVAELARGCERAIALCDLGTVARRPIATLSHGYRQRVGIAQAIIHGPSLLILDEPIQGLDPVQIVEMRKMIAALRGDHTILLSTHILSEIEQTCDRILMMHEGRIAAQGTEEELAERLQAGRRLQLEVRAGGPALRAALAGVPALEGLEVTPLADGCLRARMRIPEAERAAVARAVVGADLDLLRMDSVSTGLEAVFLQLSAAASSDTQAGPRQAVGGAP